MEPVQGYRCRAQSDVDVFEPAFQARPMRYYFNELPDGIDTESFIAGWNS